MKTFVATFATADQTDGTVNMDPTDVLGILTELGEDHDTVVNVLVGPRSVVTKMFSQFCRESNS